MQEGGRSEGNIIEKIGSSKTQSDTSSTVTKNRIKLEILKKLDLQPDKEKEVEDELISDDKSLDLYLQLLLERERRQVELLRESNLDRLNTIIDKCIKSDKFTKNSLDKVLELTYKPQQDSSNGNHHPISQRRPVPSAVHLSPDTGKRKLASPLMSPMGRHKRFPSDIPSLTTMTTTQSPYYGPTVQGGPAPWASQQYNQQPPPQQQQYEFKGAISAGLGGLTRQTAPLGENQPPQQPRTSVSQQQRQQPLFAGTYSPAQFPPGLPAPPSGYFLPTATARTAAAQTGKSSHPAAMMAPESPRRAGSAYLQPPQHVGSSLYGTNNTIKQEPSIPTRKFPGHRRSQSANVPTTHGTNPSSVKSPIRELHATPQKPVNFLIHTPKHPPPS